jgi:hypothetical protein
VIFNSLLIAFAASLTQTLCHIVFTKEVQTESEPHLLRHSTNRTSQIPPPRARYVSTATRREVGGEGVCRVEALAVASQAKAHLRVSTSRRTRVVTSQSLFIAFEGEFPLLSSSWADLAFRRILNGLIRRFLTSSSPLRLQMRGTTALAQQPIADISQQPQAARQSLWLRYTVFQKELYNFESS